MGILPAIALTPAVVFSSWITTLTKLKFGATARRFFACSSFIFASIAIASCLAARLYDIAETDVLARIIDMRVRK